MKIEYCHSSVVNIGDYDLKHIMLVLVNILELWDVMERLQWFRSNIKNAHLSLIYTFA